MTAQQRQNGCGAAENLVSSGLSESSFIGRSYVRVVENVRRWHRQTSPGEVGSLRPCIQNCLYIGNGVADVDNSFRMSTRTELISETN